MAEPSDLPDDVRAPLWARLLGFALVLAFLAFLVGVVLVRDRDRDDQSGRSATTARTVPLPADNGGSLVPRTTMTVPPGSGPGTVARSARTNTDVSIALEQVLQRDIGFIHKVSCTPAGELHAGDLLECAAASEPAVREAPPSTVVAVVVDDAGHFVWARSVGDAYSVAKLRSEPALSCDDLAGRAYPYALVLAYWEANDRPSALDPKGTGRPCTDRYSPADVDATFAAAI